MRWAYSIVLLANASRTDRACMHRGKLALRVSASRSQNGIGNFGPHVMNVYMFTKLDARIAKPSMTSSNALQVIPPRNHKTSASMCICIWQPSWVQESFMTRACHLPDRDMTMAAFAVFTMIGLFTLDICMTYDASDLVLAHTAVCKHYRNFASQVSDLSSFYQF